MITKQDNYTCDSCKWLCKIVKVRNDVVVKTVNYTCGHYGRLNKTPPSKVMPNDICHIDKYEYSNLELPND